MFTECPPSLPLSWNPGHLGIDHFQMLHAALYQSLSRIESRYFMVDRDGPPANYRERVYCYELYSQLRCRLPNGFPYTLHGEIDKHGYDEVSKHFKGPPNPDFVIHHPGNPKIVPPELWNLAIVEAKSSEFGRNKAVADVAKLRTFIEEVGYLFGIFLVFGNATEVKMKSLMRVLASDHEEHRAADGSIVVIWHQAIGRIRWSTIGDLPS